VTEVLCPGCRRVRVERSVRTWPFCSARCRDGDLAAWVDERYRVPAEETSDSGADSPEGGAAPGDAETD